MNCKISCSFGEIVDKVTILKIKQAHATSEEVMRNINNELTIIQKENPIVNNDDILFDDLSSINRCLWELEDLIRAKSKLKEFDDAYIQCAENIHKMNDRRYLIKRSINEKYQSYLKEEKLYKST